MKCELLISTMNNNLEKNCTLNRLSKNNRSVIINQLTSDDEKNYIDLDKTLPNCKILNVKETGLSKSRNRALQECSADYALICDDDITPMEDYVTIIKEAFLNHPNYDIITFVCLNEENLPFRQYPHKKTRKHSLRSLLSVSSVEIAFKVPKIKSLGLKFDESFGLGATYPTGEETIFLVDALRRGCKILFINQPICKHPSECSGFDFLSPKIQFARGAFFKRIFERLSIFYLILYLFKNYQKYDSFSDFKNTYLNLIKGSQSYQKST